MRKQKYKFLSGATDKHIQTKGKYLKIARFSQLRQTKRKQVKPTGLQNVSRIFCNENSK